MSFALLWRLLTKLEDEYDIKLRVPAIHASLYLFQVALHIPINYQFCIPGTQGLSIEAYSNDDEHGSTLDVLEHRGSFSWFIYEPHVKGMYLLANDSKRFIKRNANHIQKSDIYDDSISNLIQVIKELGADNLPYFALSYHTWKEKGSLENLLRHTPRGLVQKDKVRVIQLVNEWINKDNTVV